MINALLQQVFSAHPKLNDANNLDFGHYLAVIVVAAAVGIYHWRVLRADGGARPARSAVAPRARVVVTPMSAASPAVETAAEPEVAADHGRHYTLVVTDATDDDVHQALAALPPQASYKLTPAEQNR